jgi:hypothetical protein
MGQEAYFKHEGTRNAIKVQVQTVTGRDYCMEIYLK